MRLKNAITVVGCHAEGEVGRVITGGVLPPPGATLMAQKLHLEREADALRKFLLYEPRGGAFVHANLVVPAVSPQAAAGFIIMEPTDYPPMSGSNCICVATVLLETGMVPMQEPETRLVLETPGGLVPIVARCRDGKCVSVRLENVPCYAAALDVPIEVPVMGTLHVDVSYGGAFFAIVDARALGFAITPDEARDLVVAGERIKAAAVEQFPVRHRETADIHTITFTQFAAPVEVVEGVKTAANTVVISPGKLDRSPCGTGTSARLAVMHARGQLATGERFVSRSVIGSRFDATVVRTTTVGGEPAIVPSIEGRAWITGLHTYGLDPSDPFPQGYTLSDTWYRALS